MQVAPEFQFMAAEATYEAPIEFQGTTRKVTTVDDIIERHRQLQETRKPSLSPVISDLILDGQVSGSDDFSEFGGLADIHAEMGESESQGSDSESDSESVVDIVPQPMVEDDDDEVSDRELDDEQKAYFAEPEAEVQEQTVKPKHTFEDLNLSRPILKSIGAMNFTEPTPIQRAVIPVALSGRDIVGQAVTGSGKTAAFVLPILERLLHRPMGRSETRVLILCPTRELAQQCWQVTQALSKFMTLQSTLIVGGLSLKVQEQQLRARPDIVIATPGRLIDHVRNSPGFTLDALDVLIIDEADRMLEEGFKEELDQIIQSCPMSRQSMLFSATMTDRVDELVRMSLKKPVRLFVDPKKATAKKLVQEFVRIKTSKDQDLALRTAVLLHFCLTLFRSQTIVFFRSKSLCHRLKILFGLFGLKAGELHGNLSQEQRSQALESFKTHRVNYLLATDLASRGLDIKGVETVVNFDLPKSLDIYLHRVGRTARAGQSGKAVTLVGETDRSALKQIIKKSASEVRNRTFDVDVVADLIEKIAAKQDTIDAVMSEEKEAKEMQIADMEIRKGENLIKYAEEIKARPARTWFEKEKPKHAKAETSSSKTKRKDHLEPEEMRKQDAAVRRAKRNQQPQKLSRKPLRGRSIEGARSKIGTNPFKKKPRTNRK